MIYQIFSENEWVYPDSKIIPSTDVKLTCAKGADVCFQILTDITLTGTEQLAFTLNGLNCEPLVYQLLPACVNRNSDAVLGTTLDYETVKDFATRPAPFDVYDITYLPEKGQLKAGRAAFYVRLNVSASAAAGTFSGSLKLQIGNNATEIPVQLKVYNVHVPALQNASFHMGNWIYYEPLAKQHGIEPWTPEYFRLLERYLENQLDMRNDILMIPAGTPVRDDAGRVIDFDFTHAEQVGKLALQKGFRAIMGGFIARWKQWDENEIWLLWDRDVGTSSIEGFRQLKLYFGRAWESVQRCGWKDQYMQCMVDEPQIPNSAAYRSIAAICRMMMPGVVINDPIEAIDIGGALDIWNVKQAFYEKYINQFQQLQALGEEFWVYTCGFPSGKTMNRVLDLSLNASRLPMWMCCKYGFTGFLHWGYHFHTPGVEKDTCAPNRSCGWMPPGNGFIVYPGNGRPEYSVRAHLQRAGAYDYELLHQLMLKAPEKARAIIEKMCRSFDDYETSGTLLDSTREELLDILEQVSNQ